MKKILGYLKPFTVLILSTILLLFFQAMLDLRLPDLMSNIVNVGLQQGGIDSNTPIALRVEDMDALRPFFEGQDALELAEGYVLVTPEQATESQLAQVPALAHTNAYLLQNQASDETDNAFSTAFYALDLYMKDAFGTGASVASSAQLMQAADQLDAATANTYWQAASQAAQNSRRNVVAAALRAAYSNLGIDTSGMQTRYILFTGVRMLLASMLSVLASLGIGFCASRTGSGLGRSLRRDMFEKVERFSSEEIDRFSTASLITRTTNDVSQVQMMTTMALRMVVSAPIMAVGGVVMALKKSPSMAWTIALAALCIIGIVSVIFSITTPRFSIIQKMTDRLNLVMRENLSGILVIRAFGSQDFEQQRFDKANRDLTGVQKFVNRIASLMQPGMMIIMNGLTLVIVWVGAGQIAASSLQVGDMMAFIQYATQIIQSFLMLSMMSMMLPRALVSVRRLNEVLDTQPTITDPVQPAPLPAKLEKGLAFNHVSFKYPGADDNAVEDVSFTARPGETVALIGSTGAGKSALVNLIPRFYDVDEGSITLEGVDIRNFTQHDLRTQIGYVPQKGVLFTGDIASNLRFGKNDADQEELHTAAQVAQASDFIEALPEGYETPIAQGGTNVSGGQRQRLSIARALVKQSPIYIFDDSFSALDFKTDATLRHALKDYTQDSIFIIVAQRINTIMNADKIVVLENGRAVGIGTHNELLQTCDTYREIALSQLSKEELA